MLSRTGRSPAHWHLVCADEEPSSVQRRGTAPFPDRHLLLRRGSGSGRAQDLEAALNALGFVRVDSVKALARAHDLILWSRRGRYRPAALEAMVARRRSAFEHWTHDAAVIPMAAYPMWRLKFARDEVRLRAGWPAARREGRVDDLDAILRHISDHRPASTLEVGERLVRLLGLAYLQDGARVTMALGAPCSLPLPGLSQALDLAERVIPAELRHARPDEAETADRPMGAAFEHLGFATSGELSAFLAIATPGEAKAWCAAALAAGRIREIDVEAADGTRRRGFTTEAIFDAASALPEPAGRVRLLSPFDPMLRDRARAERLSGFRYRIEIFVPERRRLYGYCVFPVLRATGWWGGSTRRRRAARSACGPSDPSRGCGREGRCSPDWRPSSAGQGTWRERKR